MRSALAFLDSDGDFAMGVTYGGEMARIYLKTTAQRSDSPLRWSSSACVADGSSFGLTPFNLSAGPRSHGVPLAIAAAVISCGGPKPPQELVV